MREQMMNGLVISQQSSQTVPLREQFEVALGLAHGCLRFIGKEKRQVICVDCVKTALNIESTVMAWHNAQTDKLYKEAFDKGMQIGKATQALEDNKALPAIRAEAVKQFAEKWEQIKPIIKQLMQYGWAACPPNKRCADNDENTCVDCFVDAVESAFLAWHTAQLPAIRAEAEAKAVKELEALLENKPEYSEYDKGIRACIRAMSGGQG